VLRIRPVLTPAAASGLAVVMTFAAVFHLTRGEFGAIGFNLVLALLASLVSWGRFKIAPVATR
jgi:hypothetical protein